MLSEFEADTAEYILAKFGLLLLGLRDTKYGYSVHGQLIGPSKRDLWMKYGQVVIDTRIRLPGALIGGRVVAMGDTFKLTVEIY